MSNCHTQYGRLNREGTAVRMIQAMKDLAVPISKAQGMTPEQLEGKWVIGVLHNTERPEYIEEYEKIIRKFNPVVEEEPEQADAGEVENRLEDS